MEARRSRLAYIQALFISLLIHSHVTLALSWRARGGIQSAREEVPFVESSNSASQLLRAGAPLQNSFELALNELQELESEPLCHRIAARLLVNNCQLLEGKDEATILTDSGRKIRDFVDSYAASLAICDLERGRFAIPTECAKFQETTLSHLPIQNAAQLHVTSAEIDACLAGLGASDSAWSTWVSYRHKSLRFCEAARADNEKAQNVLLFQRLTTIMRKLADDVDVEIKKRMNDMDLHAQLVGDKIYSFSDSVGKLQNDIENADAMISNHLSPEIKNVQDNVDSIGTLLQMILKTITENNAKTAAAHEQSLQVVSQQTVLGVEVVVESVTAALSATEALQGKLETSHLQATKLEYRQDQIDQRMEQLIGKSDDLTRKQDVHADRLEQAQNITNEILDTLANTAASATTVGNMFPGHHSLGSWWPYIWCPVASLVMGSYGLPPSILRNLALVALGETAGFIISFSPAFSFDAAHTSVVEYLGSFIRPLHMTDDNHNSTNLTSQFESS